MGNIPHVSYESYHESTKETQNRHSFVARTHCHVSKSSSESPVTASVKDLTPLSAKWLPNDHVFNLTAFAKSQTKKCKKDKNYVAEYTGSKRFKRILDACIQLHNVGRSCLVFTKKNKRFASRLNTYTSEPAIAFDFRWNISIAYFRSFLNYSSNKRTSSPFCYVSINFNFWWYVLYFKISLVISFDFNSGFINCQSNKLPI
jgi:hypothetical protein